MAMSEDRWGLMLSSSLFAPFRVHNRFLQCQAAVIGSPWRRQAEEPPLKRRVIVPHRAAEVGICEECGLLSLVPSYLDDHQTVQREERYVGHF